MMEGTRKGKERFVVCINKSELRIKINHTSRDHVSNQLSPIYGNLWKFRLRLQNIYFSYITQITGTTKFVVVGTYNVMVCVAKDPHLSFPLFRLFLLFYWTTHYRCSDFVPRRRAIRIFKLQAVILRFTIFYCRSVLGN
jgi:hypothetical protein